jgi:hypothetical protein
MQVFAAVTADARLQVWDLQVSCLDPVESYDTSVDDSIIATKEEKEESKDENRVSTSNTASKPNTAAVTSRYEVCTINEADGLL